MIEVLYASLIFHLSKLLIVFAIIVFIYIVFCLWLTFATLFEVIKAKLKKALTMMKRGNKVET